MGRSQRRNGERAAVPLASGHPLRADGLAQNWDRGVTAAAVVGLAWSECGSPAQVFPGPALGDDPQQGLAYHIYCAPGTPKCH